MPGMEVYPVVHVQTVEQAIEQTNIAFDAAADGVFLINHNMGGTQTLFDAYKAVAAQHSKQYVGLNVLASGNSFYALEDLLEAKADGKIDRLPNGLWVDDGMILAKETEALRAKEPDLRSIQILGGAAFKYTQKYTDDPEFAAREAQELQPHVDVVTTSGQGTGKAPSPAKIAAMKAALSGEDLAVASGISIDNLHDYAGIVDKVLVSSSVETEPHSGIFDEQALRDFIAAAHQLA